MGTTIRAHQQLRGYSEPNKPSLYHTNKLHQAEHTLLS